MQVLIVEDSEFNAFCLSRLVQAVCPDVGVKTVTNSASALDELTVNYFDAVIIDGNLGVAQDTEELCNGPALTGMIWNQHPLQAIITWTDSPDWQNAFAAVFRQHGKFFEKQYCWSKLISKERIYETFLPWLEQNGFFTEDSFA